MILEILAQRFSICKVRDLPLEALAHNFVFFARTDQEFSLVCPENLLPPDAFACQQGFRGLRIQGSLDFALVGVLARLTGLLAQAEISVFALSTYDTDYLFLQEERLFPALALLRQAGYGMIFPGNAYTVEDFFQQDFPDPASNTNLN